MKNKSTLEETKHLMLAIQLIKLGARLQLLESETSLSRERLIKLYKEIKFSSPPKGMLPFSTDWFLTWRPNIHSSIFMNIYNFLVKNTELRGVYALIKAYQLYLEQVGIKLVNTDDEPSLSLTRAWTLIRFVEGRMLKMETCHCCHGQFIVNADDLNQNYTCNLCNVPSRAGKTKRVKENSLKAIEEVAYS